MGRAKQEEEETKWRKGAQMKKLHNVPQKTGHFGIPAPYTSSPELAGSLVLHAVKRQTYIIP